MGYTMVMSGPERRPGAHRARLHQRRDAARAARRSARPGGRRRRRRASTPRWRRIGELGGSTVVAPGQPVGDMGFAAYVTDPEGNVVGLWETAVG